MTMTNPVRLLDEGATDFERALLDSAAGEMPSSALSKKMIAGLSGAAALGVASTTTYAAGQTAGGFSALKWGLGGLAAIALGWGGYELSQGRSDETTPNTPTMTAPSELPESQVSPAEDGPKDQVVEISPDDDSKVAPTAARAPAAPSKTADRPREEGASLRQELALLDSARAALKSNRPDDALAAVAAYERKFPGGTLRQEATVIKVEALKARGSDGQANALTEDFLKENPHSAHKSRLRPSPEKSPSSE